MENIYKRAIDVWGIESQSNVMVEELAELTFALMKMRRSGTDEQMVVRYDNVCEEIADVRLMLNQMEHIYNKDTIDNYYKEKKERTIKKLERYEKDKNYKES